LECRLRNARGACKYSVMGGTDAEGSKKAAGTTGGQGKSTEAAAEPAQGKSAGGYLSRIQSVISAGYFKVEERAEKRRLEAEALEDAYVELERAKAERRKEREKAKREAKQAERDRQAKEAAIESAAKEEARKAEKKKAKQAERELREMEACLNAAAKKAARKAEKKQVKLEAQEAEQEKKELEALKEMQRQERARRRAQEAKKAKDDATRESRARMQLERERRFEQREREAAEALAFEEAMEQLPALGEATVKPPDQVPNSLPVTSPPAAGPTQNKPRFRKRRKEPDSSAASSSGPTLPLALPEPMEEGAAPLQERATSQGLRTGSDLVQAAPKEATAQREKVRQKLREALGRTTGEDHILRPPETLAVEIEAALHEHFGLGKEYLCHARSIVFNLKDEKNQGFRLKVLGGQWRPQDLPCMTTEDMASEAKAAERARLRQTASEAAALKPAEHCLTDAFTCESCHSTNCAYSQSLAVESCIRSGGEPTTTAVAHVVCQSCGHRWTDRSGLG